MARKKKEPQIEVPSTSVQDTGTSTDKVEVIANQKEQFNEEVKHSVKYTYKRKLRRL